MSDKEHHLHELVRIADMMESYSDDDSPDGRRFMKELTRDYKFHLAASGLKIYKKTKP